MMKRTDLYAKKEFWYFRASSLATTDAWIGAEPCLKLLSTAEPEAKGAALLKALSGSQEGVPHPTDWGAVSAPLLRLAGVRSWSEFGRNALSCSAVLGDDGTLRIIPYRNCGTSGPSRGFEALEDKAITIPANSDAKIIGEALDRAFSECK